MAGWGVALVAAAVILGPGLVAGALLRLRGVALAAAAAPLGLAPIAAASLAQVVLPFRWGPLAWGVAVAALWAAAVLARALIRAAPREAGGTSWIPLAAAATGAVAIAVQLGIAIPDPGSISQTFDNVYHLNAVRFALDTGVIAPTAQLIPGFYPSLWHATVALVAALTGASVPVAVSGTAAAVAAVVWPLSSVYLTAQVLGHRHPAVLAAGPLTAAFPAFPLLMLDFGVLYPNVLSISLLPAVLGFVLSVSGRARGAQPARPVGALVLAAAVPTLALAHPSTLMAVFLLGVWPLAQAAAGALRSGRTYARRRVALTAVAAAVGAAAAVALFLVARPTRAQAIWPPSASAAEALGDFLAVAPVGRPPAVAAAVLTAAGVAAVILVAHRHLWLVGAWASLGVLFVACLSFPDGTLRYALTGTWYSDIFRIAALVPTVAVPLATVGVAACGDAVRALARRAGRRRLLPSPVAGAFGAAVVLVATQVAPSTAAAVEAARGSYAESAYAPLLSSPERALLARVPELVPPGDVIAGSPWTGASLSYALADRETLLTHIYDEPDADEALILAHLRDAVPGSAVCDALERTRARWVLDFGATEVHGGAHVYPGLVDLDRSDAVDLVVQEGPEARLYRVVGCG